MPTQRERLKVCPACMQHRHAAEQMDGDGRCDRCGEALDAVPPRRGALARLSRATRGGLIAGALIALAVAGGGCGDDDVKSDAARADAGRDVPIATPYGISPVMLDELA